MHGSGFKGDPSQPTAFSFLQGYSGRSRPSDKGWGWGSHPDPEIRWGPSHKKVFFRLFGPHFGLKIRGGLGPPGPSPGSTTGIQCILLLTTQSDTFIGFLSFNVCKTLRGDQNLQILCLSETRSIPLNFIWESPSGVVPSSGGWSGSSSISIALHAAGTGEAREEDIGLFFSVQLCIPLP